VILGNDPVWMPFLARFLRTPLKTRDVRAVLDLPMGEVSTIRLTAEIVLDADDVAILTKTFSVVALEKAEELIEVDEDGESAPAGAKE